MLTRIFDAGRPAAPSRTPSSSSASRAKRAAFGKKALSKTSSGDGFAAVMQAAAGMSRPWLEAPDPGACDTGKSGGGASELPGAAGGEDHPGGEETAHAAAPETSRIETPEGCGPETGLVDAAPGQGDPPAAKGPRVSVLPHRSAGLLFAHAGGPAAEAVMPGRERDGEAPSLPAPGAPAPEAEAGPGAPGRFAEGRPKESGANIFRRNAVTGLLQPAEAPASMEDMAASGVDAAALPSSTPAEVLDRVMRRARMGSREGAPEIEIVLRPESLGRLRIRVSTKDRQVSVRILAEKASAAGVMADHAARLEADLAAAGFEMAHVDIRTAEEDAGAGLPQAGAAGSAAAPADAGGSVRRDREKAAGIDFFA